jgi:protein gp37
MGVSIETDELTPRANALREVPAAVRFLSCEPLLGPLPSLNLEGIDWVIVGAESGRGARPINEDWVRDIRDRCVDAGVAFFFKQHGGRTSKAGGRELDTVSLAKGRLDFASVSSSILNDEREHP